MVFGLTPWIYKQFPHEQLFEASYSPDRKYRIEYYAIPFLPFKPYKYKGLGCSDCPGYIQLIDNTSNIVLAEQYFKSTQVVQDTVTWEDDMVYIRSFVNWRLQR